MQACSLIVSPLEALAKQLVNKSPLPTCVSNLNDDLIARSIRLQAVTSAYSYNLQICRKLASERCMVIVKGL